MFKWILKKKKPTNVKTDEKIYQTPFTLIHELQLRNLMQRKMALNDFFSFLGELEDGTYYETPRKELETEFKRLATRYKNTEQKHQQIELLLKPDGRELTDKEHRTYLTALKKIKLAEEKAQPQ